VSLRSLSRLSQIVAAVLLATVVVAARVEAKDVDSEFDKAMKKRLEELTKEAKKGSAPHQNRLGTLYLTGNPVIEPDPERAVYWFTEAANQGNPMAQFNLGLCYDQGLGVAKPDTYIALEWYRKAAEQGLPQAQINAAYTLKDLHQYTDAFEYFRSAARNGDIGCTREVGIAYLEGYGVVADLEQAVLFLKRAGEAGDIRANLILADIFSGELYDVAADPELMFDHLWKAASSESADATYTNAEAMAKVAYCFDKGIGTPANPNLARKWYQKAADREYPQAMVNLGDIYAQGRDGSPDLAMAFRWYNAAANANFPPGLHNVGVAYYQGVGTDKNLKAAAEYFARAAKAGYSRSQFNLGHCYEFGEGVPANPKLAYYWYKQAAQQEDPQGLVALAWCYVEGRGTTKDPNRAKACLIRARAVGSEEATRLLDELF